MMMYIPTMMSKDASIERRSVKPPLQTAWLRPTNSVP